MRTRFRSSVHSGRGSPGVAVRCFLLIASALSSSALATPPPQAKATKKARNVIFFVGDGMSVSTVTAARVFAHGVDGELVIDTLPYTAMSRTYTADAITPDSAGTMSAMMTGVNANMGVIGFDAKTERGDFNKDGDGAKPWTLLEIAKKAGMKVGVVTTARVTHATPAGCYAHINERNEEDAIALQALPGDASYNERLSGGLDLLAGGGRRHFVPRGETDEEEESGRRWDRRDLRAEFQAAGYRYVWNEQQFESAGAKDLPLLALFESSHMEYEADRAGDMGGEPSLSAMTVKAIELLSASAKAAGTGYFLMVESGRIDHAHHDTNAYRALVDTVELDRSVGAAMKGVDLSETLIVVTADHSHVFNIAGYPLADAEMLPYKPKSAPKAFFDRPYHGILDVVYRLNHETGEVDRQLDLDGVPFTVTGYLNGPGHRKGVKRVDPCEDPSPGYGGKPVTGPNDPNYLQETAVPLAWETHGGEDVVIYAAGAGAERVRGTVKNTFVFEVMRGALGLEVPGAPDIPRSGAKD